MQKTMFLFTSLIILNLNSPVLASSSCSVDDAGLCVDGECRLSTGEIGVCAASVDGICQCEAISE